MHHNLIEERTCLRHVGFLNIVMSYVLCFGCLGFILYFAVDGGHSRLEQLTLLIFLISASLYFIFFGMLLDVISRGKTYNRLPPPFKEEDEGSMDLEEYLEIEEDLGQRQASRFE